MVSRRLVAYLTLRRLFPSKMTAFGFKTVGSDNFASAQPTGRYGHTEDMAGTALFLVSPASAHVTGNHIILDGGSRLLAQRVTGQVKL